MDFLLDPLQFDFILRVLVAAIMVGVVCSVLGTYVVLRGMAFLGDALAHTILPGVVIASMLDVPLALGALITGIIAAVGIGLLGERTDLKQDTAIGVIFAGMFALGIVLISVARSQTVDPVHILFGNLLGVSKSDLWVIAILGSAVLLTIYLFYKEFLVISFDPVLATTLRIPSRFLNYLLLVLMAVTIVTALQVVGIAMMLAMFVTPAATAYLLTHRLSSMMLVSALVGVLSSIIGFYASYYLDIASGAAIVLVTTLMFVAAFLFAPGRGLVWRIKLK